MWWRSILQGYRTDDDESYVLYFIVHAMYRNTTLSMPYDLTTSPIRPVVKRPRYDPPRWISYIIRLVDPNEDTLVSSQFQRRNWHQPWIQPASPIPTRNVYIICLLLFVLFPASPQVIRPSHKTNERKRTTKWTHAHDATSAVCSPEGGGCSVPVHSVYDKT